MALGGGIGGRHATGGEAVSSLAFGGVHGFVGVLEKLGGGAGEIGVDADTEATGNFEDGCGGGDGLGDFGEDLGSDALDVLVGMDVGEDDDEFVAAKAKDGVGDTDGLFEAIGDDGEDLVADGVPEGVIDVLEGIEIDQEDGDPMPVTIGAIKGALEPFVHQVAIRKAGEQIMVRHVERLCLGIFMGGNVRGGDSDAIGELDDLHGDPGWRPVGSDPLKLAGLRISGEHHCFEGIEEFEERDRFAGEG
jgi:hypothetical protein